MQSSLAMSVVALLWFLMSCTTPRVVEMECPSVKPAVESMPSFATQQLMDSLASVANSNHSRAEMLMQDNQQAGCSDVEKSEVGRGEFSNITCILGGASDEVIVVGAHYDKTAAGGGIADNWTGVSLLPVLYAEMSARSPHRTWIFVGFAEEETTLAGSRAFVETQVKEHDLPILAMINLDTLGLGPLQHDPGSAEALVEKAVCAAQNAGLLLEKAKYYRWLSGDWEPFKAVGIPVLNLHSVTEKNRYRIHSFRDSVGIVSPDHYTHSFQIIRQLLVELDTSLK